MRSRIVVAALLLCGGCTHFHEIHYFQSPGIDGSAPNYYRLTIKGCAAFSSARYVSGYYDEAAVDLLFNELQPASQQSTGSQQVTAAADAAPATSQTAPPKSANSAQDPATSGTQTAAPSARLTPLDSSKPGSFVMIFSTDASAVADTIGSFADSNVTAQAITNLLNSQQLRAAQTAQIQQTALKTDASAASAEISALLSQVPTTGTPQATQTTQEYLRVLNAISRALGSGQDFQTLEQAKVWFSGVGASRSTTALTGGP